MEYQMGQPFIGAKAVSISKEEFEEFIEARRVILTIWELEDCFGVFVESFLDFEKELLELCVSYYYARDRMLLDEHSSDAVRTRINLRLLTILTAAKLYEDYSKSRIPSLRLMDNGTLYKIEKDFSDAFDSSFEYRLMYGLRNYSQHRNLPLGGLTYSSANLFEKSAASLEGPSRLRITVDPYVKLKTLLSDNLIKAKLRKELEGLEKNIEKLDLKFFVRGYLGKISEVHANFRRVSDELFVSSLSSLDGALDKFQLESESAPSSLHLFKKHSDGTRDEYYIQPNHFRLLSKKRKLGGNLIHVQRGHTSSETIRRKDTYPEGHEDIWIPK